MQTVSSDPFANNANNILPNTQTYTKGLPESKCVHTVVKVSNSRKKTKPAKNKQKKKKNHYHYCSKVIELLINSEICDCFWTAEKMVTGCNSLPSSQLPMINTIHHHGKLQI